MNPEAKSRLITVAEIGALIAVLAIGLLIGWSLARRAPASDLNGAAGGNNLGPGEVATSTTLGEVPSDVRIPEAGDEQSGDVAVPSIVAEAAPNVEAKLRGFEVKVEGGTFKPGTVAVRQGDTTRIRFTAIDRDYDFTQPDLGLSAKLLQGKEQVIEVAPQTTGRFTFYCESCGGPDQGPVGYLIVAAR